MEPLPLLGGPCLYRNMRLLESSTWFLQFLTNHFLTGVSYNQPYTASEWAKLWRVKVVLSNSFLWVSLYAWKSQIPIFVFLAMWNWWKLNLASLLFNHCFCCASPPLSWYQLLMHECLEGKRSSEYPAPLMCFPTFQDIGLSSPGCPDSSPVP